MFCDEPLAADEPVEAAQATATPVEAPQGGKVVKRFVALDARRETRSLAELMDGLWPGDESSRAEQAKKSKHWWRRRKPDR